MEQAFITNIKIENVRHLKGIDIPLGDKMRHLIFTGKNGSGKTSVLKSLATYLNSIATTNKIDKAKELYQLDQKNLQNYKSNQNKLYDIQERLNSIEEQLREAMQGIDVNFSVSNRQIHKMYDEGKFVVAYYEAERVLNAVVSKHIEKVDLSKNYKVNEKASEKLLAYLVDLKMTEALAVANGKVNKATELKEWFTQFEILLREIFDDEDLRLEFDLDTFRFQILESGRNPFDFNTMSSGYSAILEIIVDLIMKMEKSVGRAFSFDVPGIVLIDEVETHLHLELQRKIMYLLTKVFPNVQFIVSTHSPFILNSVENAVIYDLENHCLVRNGLANVSYEGIVKGFFDIETISKTLKGKFERYKELISKVDISDEECEEIINLEMYLDEIPDYLALDFVTEYNRLKIEYEKREENKW